MSFAFVAWQAGRSAGSRGMLEIYYLFPGRRAEVVTAKVCVQLITRQKKKEIWTSWLSIQTLSDKMSTEIAFGDGSDDFPSQRSCGRSNYRRLPGFGRSHGNEPTLYCLVVSPCHVVTMTYLYLHYSIAMFNLFSNQSKLQ